MSYSCQSSTGSQVKPEHGCWGVGAGENVFSVTCLFLGLKCPGLWESRAHQPPEHPLTTSVAVTHVDSLASREPGLVLKDSYEAQVASAKGCRGSSLRTGGARVPATLFTPSTPPAEHSRAWANLFVLGLYFQPTVRDEGRDRKGSESRDEENVTTKIKKETGKPTEGSKPRGH